MNNRRIVLFILCLFVASSTSLAQTAPLDLDFLSQGHPWSPLIWNNFRQTPIPQVDAKNSATLSGYIKDGKLTLSLPEFLQLVVENNLALQAARYNYLIAQVDLQRARSGQAARGVPGVQIPGAFFTGAVGAGLGNITNVANAGTGGTSISGAARQVFIGPRGTADPTFSVNMSFDRVVNPLNSTRVAGVSTVAIPSAVLQTRFQQELPFGLSYSVDFNFQRQRTTQRNILYNPAYTSYFGLQVDMPILNGSGKAFTHRFVNLAENNLQSAYLSVAVVMDPTTQAASQAYWDFVGFKQRQRVAEQALTLNQRIYDATQQRIELGVQPKTDLLTAAAQVATARRDLIIAQTNVQLQEVRLKTLFTKSITPEIAAAPLEPTETLESNLDIQIPPLEEALKSAVRKPPVRLAALNVRNHEIAEAFTRSNLRPTFNLIGEFNTKSLAPGPGGMFGQMLRVDHPEFAIGFALNFSVKNRAAQADNLRARLELQQAKVVLDNARANAALNIRTGISNLTPARSEVQAAQQATIASKQTADGEQERWAGGVSTLDKVYQTQRDLVRSQLTEIQSLVNYAKLLMVAESQAGVSTTLHNLNPEEGIRGTLWKNPGANPEP